MRLNLAVFAVAGATMFTAVGCGEGDAPSEESPSATVTITEMTQLPDGTWNTTSHTAPRGPAFRPDVRDGVEARQSALYVNSACNGWQVALFSENGLVGNALCLNANGTSQRFNFAWIFPAKSVYTTTPLILYNANNTSVFLSCESGVGRYSLALPSPATSAQEAGDVGACHF
jgi:hypothetical protein